METCNSTDIVTLYHTDGTKILSYEEGKQGFEGAYERLRDSHMKKDERVRNYTEEELRQVFSRNI